MVNVQILSPLWYGFAGEGEAEVPSDDVNWSTLFDEPQELPKDEVPAPVETPPADDPVPVAPQPPVVPVPPEEEVPAPKEEPKPAEPIPTPPVEQPKPEEYEAQLQKVMGELEGMYAISKDDADLFVTEPEKALPKLAAKLHFTIMQQFAQMQQQWQQSLPDTIEQTTKVVQRKQEAATAFSMRWPELAVGEESQAAVVEAVRLVKARNPNLSLQDTIEKSGRLAYSILGKEVPSQETPAPKKAEKPVPHTPASTKSAAVQTQQLTEEEAFYASLATI